MRSASEVPPTWLLAAPANMLTPFPAVLMVPDGVCPNVPAASVPTKQPYDAVARRVLLEDEDRVVEVVERDPLIVLPGDVIVSPSLLKAPLPRTSILSCALSASAAVFASRAGLACSRR